ncbi:MAG: hypothetical protein ACRDJU_13475, partial [Actinomycetota bacterium]
ILRVDEALRGVRVGPGPHTIVYRYQPRWFPNGLAVSALACAVALLIALGPRPRRRADIRSPGTAVAAGRHD